MGARWARFKVNSSKRAKSMRAKLPTARQWLMALLGESIWWVLTVASIPLIPCLVLRLLDPVGWMERATGNGQLIFTGVGLMVGAVKEAIVLQDGFRTRARKIIQGTGLIGIIAIMGFYTAITTQAASPNGISHQDQHRYAWLSIVLFVVCASGALLGILAIKTEVKPPETGRAQPTQPSTTAAQAASAQPTTTTAAQAAPPQKGSTP